MNIYIYLVALTLILGALLPQTGRKRIFYIAIITAVHMFICAFRYEHLTGDLMKYHATCINLDAVDWLNDLVIQEGRNTGFFVLIKLVYELSGGDFQWVLIVIAVISYSILGYFIYRYSPAPWLSFLVWNCMGLFLFSLSAIKQALAMSILMLAFVGIAERKFAKFLFWTAVAGAIHMPALVFLPAYWLCQRRVNGKMILLYVAAGVALFIFKDQFVSFIRSFYYEDDELFFFSGEIGNRFIMLLGFTLFGLLLKGFPSRDMEKLFHLMAVATMLQMLAGYDHIFTRLADYYFQFSVLYIPMIFFPWENKPQRSPFKAIFPFNVRSLKLLSMFVCVIMLWFYWTYNININIAYEVDNYLNFRFMWDVIP